MSEVLVMYRDRRRERVWAIGWGGGEVLEK